MSKSERVKHPPREGRPGVARSALRLALAAFMGVAGIGHLVATRSFLGQVPSFLPYRTPIVLVSGVVEIGFALALALLRGERLRRTGWALAAFYVLIFPGNLYQALFGTDAFGLSTPGARWGRLAAQPLLIIWALWSTGAWPRRDQGVGTLSLPSYEGIQRRKCRNRCHTVTFLVRARPEFQSPIREASMSLISKQIRDHRQRTIVIVVAGLVAAGLGLYWFSPQSALINRSVNEPLPSTQGVASGGGTTGVVLAEGSFVGIEHETSGKASLIDLGGGRVFLRLEGFKTLNGPDLRVRLSTAPAGSDPAAFGASSIDLGGLKGNIGNQNYELPVGADPSRFASAVIWCRRFSTAFGAAPLTQIPA